jgi:hypothetical protein
VTQTVTAAPGGNSSEAIHFYSTPTAIPSLSTSNPTPKKPNFRKSRVPVPPLSDEEHAHYLTLTQANLEALRKPQIDLIARQTQTYSSTATKKSHIERILNWQVAEKAAARASARAATRKARKLHKALFDAFDAVVRPEMTEEEAKVYEESLVQQKSPKLKLKKKSRKRKEPASPVVMGAGPKAAKKARIEGLKTGEGKGVGDGAVDGEDGGSADAEMIWV